MVIELTHEQKVQLLEAIKAGKFDTALLGGEFAKYQEVGRENIRITKMTDEQLNEELVRLYLFDSAEEMRQRSNIMLRYANGEIDNIQFRKEMLSLMTPKRSDTNC